MQKVVELHSLSANAVDGPEWVKCQALVYAWCGERNRALEPPRKVGKPAGQPVPRPSQI